MSSSCRCVLVGELEVEREGAFAHVILVAQVIHMHASRLKETKSPSSHQK